MFMHSSPMNATNPHFGSFIQTRYRRELCAQPERVRKKILLAADHEDSDGRNCSR